MTEYWKSHSKYYCKICKVFMTDSKMTIRNHEAGGKHKEKARDAMKALTKKAIADRDAEKEKRDWEKAAQQAYAADLESGDAVDPMRPLAPKRPAVARVYRPGMAKRVDPKTGLAIEEDPTDPTATDPSTFGAAAAAAHAARSGYDEKGGMWEKTTDDQDPASMTATASAHPNAAPYEIDEDTGLGKWSNVQAEETLEARDAAAAAAREAAEQAKIDKKNGRTPAVAAAKRKLDAATGLIKADSDDDESGEDAADDESYNAASALKKKRKTDAPAAAAAGATDNVPPPPPPPPPADVPPPPASITNFVPAPVPVSKPKITAQIQFKAKTLAVVGGAPAAASASSSASSLWSSSSAATSDIPPPLEPNRDLTPKSNSKSAAAAAADDDDSAGGGGGGGGGTAIPVIFKKKGSGKPKNTRIAGTLN